MPALTNLMMQRPSARRLGPTLSQLQKTRYALSMPQPLARIVDQLKREPSRTGSIVITVFGDAIVPRGGSVWLGTLLAFFETIDIDSSVVRTAMSRLTADGWFERAKVGRNSFYRLVKRERQTFDIATKHIYGPPASDWTGRFELLLIGNGGDRDASREALKNAGFGSPLPGGWIGRGERLADADAFTARILLIHHYRRVVLRDPLLPTALLPSDWPGRAARTLCGEIYRALLPASEQWLDRYGSNEAGALPKAGRELARRFGD